MTSLALPYPALPCPAPSTSGLIMIEGMRDKVLRHVPASACQEPRRVACPCRRVSRSWGAGSAPSRPQAAPSAASDTLMRSGHAQVDRCSPKHPQLRTHAASGRRSLDAKLGEATDSSRSFRVQRFKLSLKAHSPRTVCAPLRTPSNRQRSHPFVQI